MTGGITNRIDRSLDLTWHQYSGSDMHWKLLNNIINERLALLSLSKQLKDVRWRPWVSCLMWAWRVFVIVMGLKSRAQKQRNHHGFHHKTWAKWDVSILTLCKYAKSLKQQPIWFAFKFNLKFVFSIQIIK